MTQPAVLMIAGPNGAGKTTLAYEALRDFFSVNEFVNADEIARGLSPFNSESQAVAAGRLMLRRMDDLMAARKSFAFEATGASRIFADKLRAAQKAGYKIELMYVWLPSAAMAKSRVRLRVSQGGHDIPENTIDRRYQRSVENLVRLYLPVADDARIYSGSATRDLEYRLIAEKTGDKFSVFDTAIWQSIAALAKGEN